MFKSRLFNLSVALALVIAASFTVQEAIAKANSHSQAKAATEANTVECASASSRHSLQTEVVEETGIRLPYSEDGPTGIDGGLINLLSSDRACSK